MRPVAIIVLILSLLFAGEATAGRRNTRAKTSRPVEPCVEYVGVVSPDSSKMFLLKDFPSALSRSRSFVTSLRQNVFISPDSLPSYPARTRYLAYTRVNAQVYGYPDVVKGIKEKQMVSMLLVPMIPPQAFLKASYTTPSLRLSVDYTLCLYDTQTHMTLVMHPFFFEVEQTRKERRAVQLMQPEGVEVDYPLVDKLHEAMLAEYERLLTTLGVR